MVWGQVFLKGRGGAGTFLICYFQGSSSVTGFSYVWCILQQDVDFFIRQNTLVNKVQVNV